MSGWKSTSIDFLIIPAGHSPVSLWRDLLPGCDLHIYIYIMDQAINGSPSLPDMFEDPPDAADVSCGEEQSGVVINLQQRSVRIIGKKIGNILKNRKISSQY